MSINKLSHLKEGEKIYLEVTRVFATGDDTNSMCFETNCISSVWVNDDDIFFFPDDLKQLANDGMPKQGEMIEVTAGEGLSWRPNAEFVCMYKGEVMVLWGDRSGGLWNKWRYPPKKTELTLAEIEERLGLEKDSLIIK